MISILKSSLLLCFVLACTYYLEYNNRYFIIHQQNMTYSEGRSYCQAIGGDLGVVDDSKLSSFLNGYLYWTQKVWIGLKDAAQLNDFHSFYWVSGEVASSYTDWGAQSYNSKHDCVLIQKNYGVYNWINVACNDTAWVLCEFGNKNIAQCVLYFGT